MRDEDAKRLQREADIAAAKRGPDYVHLEKSISANKADARKWAARQAEIDIHTRKVVAERRARTAEEAAVEASRKAGKVAEVQRRINYARTKNRRQI